MTTVTIPALLVVGLAGDTGSVVLSYDLVSSGLRPLIGMVSADGSLVTCHGSTTISDTDVDNPVVSWDLTPQAQIVTPDGLPSYYRITCLIESDIVTQTVWVVQVPELPASIDLRELVGAAAIPAPGLKSGAVRVEIVSAIPETEIPNVVYLITE